MSIINGTTGNDTLAGTPDSDTLFGLAGNDTLDGGGGVDTMSGGTGNDTYLLNTSLDVVLENFDEGTDTIISGTGISLAARTNVENLTLTGTNDVNGFGNELVNVLVGNSGNNLLDGHADADTMTGGLGNDTYVVDNAGDVIMENASEGTDSVQSKVSFTLGANVENLTLTDIKNVNATGNAADNVITGNAGNNTLMGAAGNDTLIGGAGNDTYLFAQGDGHDVVSDTGGTDVIRFDASVSASGVLYSQSGNDLVINYGTGDDMVTMTGFFSGAANQAEQVVFSDNTVHDVAFIQAHLGTSTSTTITGTTGNDTLTGSGSNDTLIGLGGNDTFIGGAGNDTFQGGSGNDTFVLAQGGGNDVISDEGGTDVIRFDATVNASSVTYTQSGSDLIIHYGTGTDTATVTNFFATGAANQTEQVVFNDNTVHDVAFIQAHLTGSGGGGAGSTTFLGATGNDVLIGGAGDDQLAGGKGSDLMIDLSGNNTFNGGTGNDTMVGGAGNDTYLFARGDGHDMVTDTGGNDVIRFDATVSASDVTYSQNGNDLVIHYGIGNGIGAGPGNGSLGNNTIDLVGFFSPENQHTQISFNGTTVEDTSFILAHLAPPAPQVLIGGNAFDSLSGGGGNDRILGGNGDDTLEGNGGNDLVNGGNGNDVLAGGADNDLLNGNNGNDFLTGGAGNDRLIGGNGIDVLNGGAGQDTLSGGNGADIFVFDSATDASADVITDFQGRFDTIEISGVLTGFDPLTSNLSDFVETTRVGGNTILSVDADGTATGSNFVQLATLHGVLDAATLAAAGHLVIT